MMPISWAGTLKRVRGIISRSVASLMSKVLVLRGIMLADSNNTIMRQPKNKLAWIPSSVMRIKFQVNTTFPAWFAYKFSSALTTTKNTSGNTARAMLPTLIRVSASKTPSETTQSKRESGVEAFKITIISTSEARILKRASRRWMTLFVSQYSSLPGSLLMLRCLVVQNVCQLFCKPARRMRRGIFKRDAPLSQASRARIHVGHIQANRAQLSFIF